MCFVTFNTQLIVSTISIQSYKSVSRTRTIERTLHGITLLHLSLNTFTFL